MCVIIIIIINNISLIVIIISIIDMVMFISLLLINITCIISAIIIVIICSSSSSSSSCCCTIVIVISIMCVMCLIGVYWCLLIVWLYVHVVSVLLRLYVMWCVWLELGEGKCHGTSNTFWHDDKASTLKRIQITEAITYSNNLSQREILAHWSPRRFRYVILTAMFVFE